MSNMLNIAKAETLVAPSVMFHPQNAENLPVPILQVDFVASQKLIPNAQILKNDLPLSSNEFKILQQEASNVLAKLRHDEDFLMGLQDPIAYLNQIPPNSKMTLLMACAALGKIDLGSQLIFLGALVNGENEQGENALHIACIAGGKGFVYMLLKNGVDVNKPCTGKGFTPLMYAVQSESEEIVKILIDDKADVNAHARDGTDAAQLAAEKGFIEILKTLIDAKCNINSRDVNGMTPLMKAASHYHHMTVELLVKRGADLNAANDLGYTAVHFCAESNNAKKSLEVLINANAKPNLITKNGCTPLMLAIVKQKKVMFEILLKCKKTASSINEKDNNRRTALYYAVSSGNKEFVRSLLNFHADPNIPDQQGYTPLMLACQNNDDEIVSLLKSQQKTFRRDGFYINAIFLAIQNKQKKIVQTLLSGFGEILYLFFKRFPQLEPHFRLLQTAASNEDKDIINLILKAGANVNAVDIFHRTALFTAASLGHVEIVRLLVDRGANVDIPDVDKNTPLIIASWSGHVSVVKILIDAKASATNQNILGRSALMEAANRGNENIVKLLCDYVDNLDAVDNMGWTALMLAAQSAKDSVLKFLIERGASFKTRSVRAATALMICTSRGRAEAVEYLLKKGADLHERDENGWNTLFHAAYNVKAALVKVLIERGADVNEKCSTQEMSPLTESARRGDQAMTEELIKFGADVNSVTKDGLSPLHYATLNRHHEIAELLLEKGAEVNMADKAQRTALMLAADIGDAESIRLLLEHGADCEIYSLDNWTPLMFCSQHGFTECMEVLLEKEDKNIESVETKGHSALSISAANGRRDAVCLLLTKNANPNSRNGSKQTSLMLSAQNGHVDVVRNLIKYNADLEMQDKNGKTALIIAAEKSRTRIVKVLTAAGADVNIKDNNHMTAINMAAQNGNKEIVIQLIKKKADIEIADKQGNTPLLSSSLKGFSLIMHELLIAKADITKRNKKGESAIEISIKNKNLTAVETCRHYLGVVTDEEKQKLITLAKEKSTKEILTQLKLISTGTEDEAKKNGGVHGDSFSASDVVSYMVDVKKEGFNLPPDLILGIPPEDSNLSSSCEKNPATNVGQSTDKITNEPAKEFNDKLLSITNTTINTLTVNYINNSNHNTIDKAKNIVIGADGKMIQITNPLPADVIDCDILPDPNLLIACDSLPDPHLPIACDILPDPQPSNNL